MLRLHHQFSVCFVEAGLSAAVHRRAGGVEDRPPKDPPEKIHRGIIILVFFPC